MEVPRKSSERTTAETRCASARPVSVVCCDACLVHIYPSGPSMGRRYPLPSQHAVLIGRGSDCAILIEDNSVSRRHARIDPTPEGYLAQDLDSTNGTFVNDQPVTRKPLADGDYLRVGNCIYRFLAGGNIEMEYHEEIYRLTIIDALTDVPNKRCLLEFLARELSRSTRYSRPLSLLLLDIDYFKQINDERGHLGGDHVLRELAGRLKTVIRAEELLARYGGEEFAVVLPEATAENALLVAERLRRLVQEEGFRFDGHTVAATVSVGVASTAGGEDISPAQMIERADEKLYDAKRTGRNCVRG